MLNLIEVAHEWVLGAKVLLQKAFSGLQDLRCFFILAHLLEELSKDQV